MSFKLVENSLKDQTADLEVKAVPLISKWSSGPDSDYHADRGEIVYLGNLFL